jgi:hypothetical protein
LTLVLAIAQIHPLTVLTMLHAWSLSLTLLFAPMLL